MRSFDFKLKDFEFSFSTLEAITILSFLPNNIKNRIDELGTFCVMTFGPIVASTGLSKDEVVRTEDLAIGTGPDTVHCSRLEIHEYRTRNKSPTGGLIVVNIHSLQLEVGFSNVPPSWIDAMLIADNFPELGTDLVPALAGLDMKDFPHFICNNQSQNKIITENIWNISDHRSEFI